MQNAGMRALGLDWCYVAFDVPPERLETALRGAGAMRFVGVNLTVPHKLLALERMDVLDESARRWGAVNTVRFEARVGEEWRPLGELPLENVGEVRMQGFNTDADAILRAVREDVGVEPRGGKVLLLGAGGTGRVAALRLAVEGVAKLWLVNRTGTKAQQVAEEVRSIAPQADVRVGYPPPSEEVDLVLNATSAGLRASDPLPYDPDRFEFRRARAAYDMIYRPAETRFLENARAAGCRVANGLGMLLYQGAAALEIWSGRIPPAEEMRRALWANVYGETA